MRMCTHLIHGRALHGSRVSFPPASIVFKLRPADGWRRRARVSTYGLCVAVCVCAWANIRVLCALPEALPPAESAAEGVSTVEQVVAAWELLAAEPSQLRTTCEAPGNVDELKFLVCCRLASLPLLFDHPWLSTLLES